MNGINQNSVQKERILAKASMLFWKNGYTGTTMRAIAKEYGCKAANIYNFFPNKEAILYEFLYTQIKLIVSDLEHLEDDQLMSPVEQLRCLINIHLKHALSYSKTSRSLFDVGMNMLSESKLQKVIELRDRYDHILCIVIQRGIDAGEFACTDTKLTAFHIASIIVRTLIWFSPNGRLSFDEIADNIFNFVLNGLRGGDRK